MITVTSMPPVAGMITVADVITVSNGSAVIVAAMAGVGLRHGVVVVPGVSIMLSAAGGGLVVLPVVVWTGVLGVVGHRVTSVAVVGRKVRSRRLLLTTKTLEKAIAAPASIGLSRPSAASGMAATL